MKKFLTLVLAVVLLAPAFARADQTMNTTMQPPMGTVTGEMKGCVGTWSGKGTMVDMKTGKTVPYSEQLTIQPALSDKFMVMQTVSAPDPMGNVFQGTGYSTYYPSENKYAMYWFDSTGFGGKFDGTKTGNTITYTYEQPTGEKTVLNMIMDSNTQHHMIMQSIKPGEAPKEIMNVTYTKISSTVQAQQQPMQNPKVNVPSY